MCFQENDWQTPSVSNTVDQVFLQVNTGFLKKVICSVCNSQHLTSVFSLGQLSCFDRQPKCDFLCSAHSITQTINKNHVQEFIFYTINNFY